MGEKTVQQINELMLHKPLFYTGIYMRLDSVALCRWQHSISIC